jgi:hypothetical protein
LMPENLDWDCTEFDDINKLPTISKI